MKVVPGDWLMNAGIVGYLRICQLAGKKSDISKGYIEVNASDLEHFTESYFTAVLMRRVLRMFRLRTEIFADVKTKMDNKQFSELRTKCSELESNSIRTIQPNYESFDSTLNTVIKIAQEFREQALNLCVLELSRLTDRIQMKNIEKIKKKLDDAISEDIRQLQDTSLKFVYVYLQRFYRNKSVIGNPSVSNIGRKQSFRRAYVEAAIKQLNSTTDNTATQSNGLLCRFCKQNRVIPNGFYDVNSIFAEGMFSTTALTISFKNFFYNMQPDLFVCRVCQLLLICAWTGFTEIPWRFRDEVNNTEYIFVNLPSLELLWRENSMLFIKTCF
jgi:hypothetical protein